jgi:predicted enzyme related to lactoylglutathione lyase
MILGLRTAVYTCADLVAGKAFYAAVVGHPPYFDEPFYVGYAVGGFELGLVPDGPTGMGGTGVLWGVDDLEAEVARVSSLGAKLSEAGIQDVGRDIRVAEFTDPFGNRFGLIHNPHFDPAAVR